MRDNKSARIMLLKLLSFSMILCVVFVAMSPSAWSQPAKKEVIKVAHFFVASYQVPLYALKEGKVKSDIIDVELHPMGISALIMATGTKQYDVVDLAAAGFPLAVKRGLDLVILASSIVLRTGHYIVVKPNSPIKSAADLKGKTLGVSSIGSTSVIQTRMVLRKKYRLRTGIKGADITLIEAPLLSLPAMLERDQLDAIIVFAMGGYKGLRQGNMRIIADIGIDYKQTFGSLAATAVWAGYRDKINKRPQAFREFVRVLKASVDYAAAHPDEVYPAVARKYKTDEGFLRTYWQKWRLFPVSLDDKYVRMIQVLWKEAKAAGYLKNYPPVKSVIFR